MMPPAGIDIWSPNAVLLERDLTTGELREYRNPDERDGLTATEWLKLRPRGHRDWGPLFQPQALAPPELFWKKPADNEPPRPSPSLATRLIRISVGFKTRFTEERFQAALAAECPETRHRTILSCWIRETTDLEIGRILAERGFTMRRLAHAMHVQGRTRGPGTQLLNLWAADSLQPANRTEKSGGNNTPTGSAHV